uniref:Transposase (putative) gypsy type domain-containing protein n=1 Tax=Cajanus cajan TaxID=3821 RepID=A0A151QZK6_CAJCA|nr:hypothetical protein KK1_043296 [Cajanus cajan]
MGGTPNTPFFYIYQCFFRDLGVCLPFSQFECDFLNFINMAPCQLHPNSWGFLRAFQVLCSALGIGLSLPVFLHFYQLKLGEPPLGWVSLNRSKAGGLFSLYSKSYKGFKQGFFRVRPKEADPLVDEVFHFGRLPRFPLLWQQNLIKFNRSSNLQLSESDTAAIADLAALPRPLDCKLVLSLANLADKERGLESEYLIILSC